MNRLTIYGTRKFTLVARAFGGEFESDIDLAAEIIMVDEEEIRRLNREKRSNDSVTDVLSFPAFEIKCGQPIYAADHAIDVDDNGNLFIGSIAICEKRAAEQAEEYGHTFKRELNYLAVHGLCHLLGYDHEDENDRAVMRAKEEAVLAKLGLSRN